MSGVLTPAHTKIAAGNSFDQHLRDAIVFTNEMLFHEEPKATRLPANCIGTTVLLHRLVGHPEASGLCYDGGHFWNFFSTSDGVVYADAYYGIVEIPGEGQSFVSVAHANRQYELGNFATEFSGCDIDSFDATYLAAERVVSTLTVEQALESADSYQLRYSQDELYISPAAVSAFLDTYLRSRKPVSPS